jgi:formate-dependent phosphoribosylglycinamide formyltransferase (GAR transformylase)
MASALNVLFVGGGRRVDLARLFKRLGCSIYAYELSDAVPIASEARIIEGRKWTDNELPTHLQMVVFAHNIGLVIPLDCRGVDALSRLNLSVPTVVPHAEAAQACLNKRMFEIRCRRLIPDLYPTVRFGQPMVQKPVC